MGDIRVVYTYDWSLQPKVPTLDCGGGLCVIDINVTYSLWAGVDGDLNLQKAISYWDAQASLGISSDAQVVFSDSLHVSGDSHEAYDPHQNSDVLFSTASIPISPAQSGTVSFFASLNWDTCVPFSAYAIADPVFELDPTNPLADQLDFVITPSAAPVFPELPNVPEPAATLMLTIGLAGLGARRRLH